MLRLIFLLGISAPFVSAQTTITIEQIPDFIDKKVKVCGKIYGSYVTKTDPPVTLLNLGGQYPDNPLTLAVFAEDLKKFSYVPADFLPDKNVCATGKIVLYKEKPEIILNSEKDLEILEE